MYTESVPFCTVAPSRKFPELALWTLFPLSTAAHPLLSFRRMWLQAACAVEPSRVHVPQALVPEAGIGNEGVANQVTAGPAKHCCTQLNGIHRAKVANADKSRSSTAWSQTPGEWWVVQHRQSSFLGVCLSLLFTGAGSGRGNTGCRQNPPSYFYISGGHMVHSPS